MKEKTPGFYYLLLFFVFIIFAVIIAIVAKVVIEINSSTFKNNTFSLLIVSKDSKLIYLDKDEKSVLFLALGDIEKYVKGKNTLEVTFALGIPINGILYDQKTPQNIDDFVQASNEFRLIFGAGTKLKNLNRFDVYKIISSSRDSIKDNRKEVRVNLFNQEEMKKIDEYFVDSVVRNSNKTIEIDNGTKINGLGNLLAIILTKQGYNVISVRTAKTRPASFIAYRDQIGIVASSLKGLTNFELVKGGVSPASDLTIFLGDDVDSMLTP